MAETSVGRKNFFNAFKLPYPVLAIATGSLMSRFGTSMVIPYITVLLVEAKHLPIYWGGLTIGLYYLAQALMGSLGGHKLSKIEPFKLIKVGIFFYTLLFIVLGLISRFVHTPLLVGFSFVLCFLLLGTCASIIETTGQFVISSLTPMPQKYFAFNLRYTFINIGTSIGPLVAIALGILNTNWVFYATAIAIFVYFALIKFTVNTKIPASTNGEHSNFLHAFTVLFQDKKLLYFIIAAILCYIGFSQMNTLFAYVTYHYALPSHVFAVMYAINGLCIILLQVPIGHYIKRFNIYYVIAVGIILLTIGLLGTALSSTHALLYYLSMFIFTLGEMCSLSLVGVYIDQLATPERRYIYFGISNFALIGSIMGPPLATMITHYFNVEIGLISAGVVTVFGVPFILAAKRAVALSITK
jgi:MFS family permease